MFLTIFTYTGIEAATIVGGIVFLMVMERLIHRDVLHNPRSLIQYAYIAHHKIHHSLFGGDETYFLQNRPAEHLEPHEEKIPMAWWAKYLIVPLGSVPFMLSATPFVLFAWWWSAAIMVSATGLVLSALAFATYEYMHYCMHHPKNRRIERTALFKWLDRHHLIHHLDPRSNLNVVMFPFPYGIDWWCGTLRLDHPGLAAAQQSRHRFSVGA